MKTSQTQTLKNVPGNTTIISKAIPLDQAFGYSVQGIWKTISGLGTNGTLKVQCSLDYQQDDEGNITNSGTWLDIAGASVFINSGDGDTLFVFNAPQYLWARVVWQSNWAGQNAVINAWTVVKGA